MASRGARPSIRAQPGTKPSNEEVLRLVADFNVVSQRVNEMAAEAGNMRASYVDSLRSAVSAEVEFVPDSKLTALERVLNKVAELDRLVLLKTAPEATPVVRRSSKSVELSSLPTHLFLINRTLDLYAEAKRVTVIRTHTVAGASGSNAEDVPESPRSSRDKKMIDTLTATIARLNKQVEEFGGQAAGTQQELMNMRSANMKLQEELERLKAERTANEVKLSKFDEMSQELFLSKQKAEDLKREMECVVQLAQSANDTGMREAAHDGLLSVLSQIRKAIDNHAIDSFPTSAADSLVSYPVVYSSVGSFTYCFML
jgi:hypothetical protein